MNAATRNYELNRPANLADVADLKSVTQVREILPAFVSPEAYREVLLLRHECYLDAEKIDPTAGPEEMGVSSDHDRNARIFGLYLQGDLAQGPQQKMIGTFKVVVPSAQNVLESVDGALGYYPKNFPPKSDVIEVSGLCVRRGFRRSNVLKAVFEQVHRILVESGRSTILISADLRLQSKYRFIGFKRTGFRYVKPNSKFADLEVMISRQKILGTYGLHADPLRWNIFLRDVTQQLVSEGRLKHSPLQRALFKFYEVFAPLSHLLELALSKRQLVARKRFPEQGQA